MVGAVGTFPARMSSCRSKGQLYRRLISHKSLNIHNPLFLRAPRPPSHLRDQLERPLIGPKVRDVKTGIGTYNANHRDIRKMQTFSKHLGACKYIDLALAEIPQDAVIICSLHRVAVDAGYFCIRELLGDLFFELLRALAYHRHPFAA